ncbi:MAG: NUDIX hydrolase [Chloroflexi bacterium]|nr:NUDIX hydrolase [Chloroflexota bacterium]
MSCEHTVTRAFSHLLRRFPFIMRMPYLVYSRMQARYTIGVAAVILDSADRILLVEHAYHPRFAWGLPGGWIDKDEDPSSAILRELSEELQLNARVLRVVHSSKTAPNHIDLAFQCEALSPIGNLSHELLGFRWVARADLPEIKRFHRQAIDFTNEQIQGGETWERV